MEEGKEVEAEVAAEKEEEEAVEMTTTGARAAAGKTSMVASDLRCEASSVPHGREARCCVTACHMASMGQPDTWAWGMHGGGVQGQHATWGLKLAWGGHAAAVLVPAWGNTCCCMRQYMLMHDAINGALGGRAVPPHKPGAMHVSRRCR